MNDVWGVANFLQLKACYFLCCSSVEQRPLWDRVEKLQPRPGSGSSSGSSNSSSQASPSDRFRPRCESPGTVLARIFFTAYYSLVIY